MPALPNDHHAPHFHVRSVDGYVNDPNGPVHYRGVFHLYFQQVFDTPRTGPVHWGHATSSDLVTWTLHRPALTPSSGTPDEGGCWSGNTVPADDRLYAFYSAFDPANPFQPVRRAESADGFEFTGSVPMVGPPDASESPVQFRDPFVWWHHGRWCMIVGAGLAGDDADGGALGQARLYESSDLTRWSYVGPFASRRRTGEGTDHDTGMMWECPQYAALGEWGVLLVGAWDSHQGITHVLAISGRDQADRLADPGPAVRADQGPNFYAPSVMRDPSGRVLVWGWVTEGRETVASVEADWSGMLTLPRVLTVTGAGEPRWHPPAELAALRDGAVGCVEGPLEDGSSVDVVDVVDVPAQFELDLALTASGTDRDATRVRLVTSGADGAGEPEHLDLLVDWRAGTVAVDRDLASRDPRSHRGTFTIADAVAAAGDEDAEETGAQGRASVRFRLLVDGSVGELFAADQTLTFRFYPQSPPPWTLRVTPGAGGPVDGRVTVWRLRRSVR
ncbi:glycoside hydrolase family 32 protein [Actinopolymorpha singaporensis]